MNGLNKVIIVGTLGSDPKTHTSKEGRPYTTLSLATNRRWKTKEGVSNEKTDWHKVTVWGRQAELCQDFLRKGSPVCVEGHLSTFQTEEDGRKRWHTLITAEDIKFMSGSRNSSAQS